MLEFEADASIGTLCHCGIGTRTIQCHDCVEYEASCDLCFIKAHRNTPFHWAEVWDEKKGFFQRKDISMLGHVIQFGHKGMACPSPAETVNLIVLHNNGVHATRVSFCSCKRVDRVEQLMRARLFPATPTQPETAFSFAVLKEFHLHHLESAKGAYDYEGALRRLTDNAFTLNVPVRDLL